MSVSSPHFFGSMSNPFIDNPLIDSLSRTIAAKGMAEHMPATKAAKRTAFQAGSEMVVALVDGQFSSRSMFASFSSNITEG